MKQKRIFLQLRNRLGRLLLRPNYCLVVIGVISFITAAPLGHLLGDPTIGLMSPSFFMDVIVVFILILSALTTIFTFIVVTRGEEEAGTPRWEIRKELSDS